MNSTHATPAAVRDDYETVCEKARLAAGDIDNGKWRIGELACEVATHYGEKNLADFAKDINRSRSSVYDYRAVWEFYDAPSRDTFRAMDNLTWSHFKKAMKAKTLEKAEEWLELAATETLTVDDLERRMLIKLTGETLTKLTECDMTLADFERAMRDLYRSLCTSHGDETQIRIKAFEVTTGKGNKS